MPKKLLRSHCGPSHRQRLTPKQPRQPLKPIRRPERATRRTLTARLTHPRRPLTHRLTRVIAVSERRTASRARMTQIYLRMLGQLVQTVDRGLAVLPRRHGHVDFDQQLQHVTTTRQPAARHIPGPELTSHPATPHAAADTAGPRNAAHRQSIAAVDRPGRAPHRLTGGAQAEARHHHL